MAVALRARMVAPAPTPIMGPPPPPIEWEMGEKAPSPPHDVKGRVSAPAPAKHRYLMGARVPKPPVEKREDTRDFLGGL